MNPNLIDNKILSSCAELVGTFLTEMNVHCIADLESLMGKEYHPSNTIGAKLQLLYGDSNNNTLAHTVSCCLDTKGIALELKLNLPLDYTQLIVKNEVVLEGYAPFYFDIHRNIVQIKRFEGAELSIAREELARLRKI